MRLRNCAAGRLMRMRADRFRRDYRRFDRGDDRRRDRGDYDAMRLGQFATEHGGALVEGWKLYGAALLFSEGRNEYRAGRMPATKGDYEMATDMNDLRRDLINLMLQGLAQRKDRRWSCERPRGQQADR